MVLEGISLLFSWPGTIVLLEIINSNPHQKALVARGPCSRFSSGRMKGKGKKRAEGRRIVAAISLHKAWVERKGARALEKWGRGPQGRARRRRRRAPLHPAENIWPVLQRGFRSIRRRDGLSLHLHHHLLPQSSARVASADSPRISPRK